MQNIEYPVNKISENDGMSELQKPTIGLKPRWLHDSQRAKEILEAIERYTDSNILIPKAWIDELKDLFENYFKQLKTTNHAGE